MSTRGVKWDVEISPLFTREPVRMKLSGEWFGFNAEMAIDAARLIEGAMHRGERVVWFSWGAKADLSPDDLAELARALRRAAAEVWEVNTGERRGSY